jgi:thymidylate synthase
MNNHFFKGEHVNGLYREIIKTILTKPDYVARPRGMDIKEIIAPKVVLTNPRNCLTTIKDRKLSYPFSVVEKFEYLYGKHDPQRLIAYNKQFDSFSNKYGRFDGSYSERINYWFEHIYRLLITDPDTRQAVITIYGPQDRHESKDIPCTLSQQYIIRDNKLHLITTMRSNDMLWGFPYDVNGFCFLQEVMASWLRIEMGTYTHTAGSIHVYTSDPERITDTMNCSETITVANPVFDLTYEETKQYLPMFISAEECLRTGNAPVYLELKKTLPSCLKKYMEILEPKWIPDVV